MLRLNDSGERTRRERTVDNVRLGLADLLGDLGVGQTWESG